MSVRFSSVQHLFEKELRVSALQLCVMDASGLGVSRLVVRSPDYGVEGSPSFGLRFHWVALYCVPLFIC